MRIFNDINGVNPLYLQYKVYNIKNQIDNIIQCTIAILQLSAFTFLLENI